MHNLEEARIACHAYFPCTGFVAFRMAEASGVDLLYVLYTTHMVAYAAAPKQQVYTPHLVAYTEMSYVGTWDLQRFDPRQCTDPTLDVTWYWTTWSGRSTANNWPFVEFGANIGACTLEVGES